MPGSSVWRGLHMCVFSCVHVWAHARGAGSQAQVSFLRHCPSCCLRQHSLAWNCQSNSGHLAIWVISMCHRMCHRVLLWCWRANSGPRVCMSGSLLPKPCHWSACFRFSEDRFLVCMLYIVRAVLSSPDDFTSPLCCVVRRAPAQVLECRFNSHGMCYFQVNVFRTLCDLPCSTFFYHSSWGCFLCYVGFWHLDDTGQHNSASLQLDSILCKYKWKPNPFFQPLGWPHIQDSCVASSVCGIAVWPHQFRPTLTTWHWF